MMFERAYVERAYGGPRVSGKALGPIAEQGAVEAWLARAKAFINSTDAPIVMTDAADGTIVHCNAPWVAMCGYARDEAVGRTNAELLQGPETDRGAARSMVRELRLGHAKARAVLRNYKKDGAPFWNDLLVAHVTGADDGAGFDVAILREADHEADVDAGSASLWFAMKRRLAPFTGEMCEGGLVGW